MSRVRADRYTNFAANGPPSFPNGANVTGNVSVSSSITAAEYYGDGSGLTGIANTAIIVSDEIQTGIITSNQYDGFLWVDSSLF